MRLRVNLMRFTMNLMRGESHKILSDDFFKKAEEKLSLICAERVMLEEYMRKACLENPSDGKFIGLHEEYFDLFKDPISFEDDGNRNNVRDDDDGNGDDGDDDANDGDGNVVENDANECDKNPNGSNQSFGFNKISLDDFGNDRGPTESEPVDPTKQGTVVDVNIAKEGVNRVENYGIMSSPEEFTQWLNKNVNLVGEACDSIATEVTSSHFEKFILYGIRLNLETLSPGLWLDANVIDCWGAILNYEERFRAADSKSRHFFPTGCITESMLDGTFTSFDEKWKIFSDQVNAQFNGNEVGRGLEGIDLKKLFSQHLKLYGHPRHAMVARVKHTIPKLKWKTKENLYDCGIFTMLHMENFNGGPASDFDCGLPVESQLQLDILRLENSHEIPEKSHEIQYESLEIPLESFKIPKKSPEIQYESFEIPCKSLLICCNSRNLM
ncbi:ulp1 protease family, C-terminal catalytic domain-containing protein [Tanacetum coccineum]